MNERELECVELLIVECEPVNVYIPSSRPHQTGFIMQQKSSSSTSTTAIAKHWDECTCFGGTDNLAFSMDKAETLPF